MQAAPATPVPPTTVQSTRPGSPPAPPARLPLGTVVSSQPAVPTNARVLRANNLHRERTAEEYNELLRGTLQPLTQFSVTDVARGFGHIYVTAEIFNKYYSTVDSVDIQHPWCWHLRLRGRSNSGDLYRQTSIYAPSAAKPPRRTPNARRPPGPPERIGASRHGARERPRVPVSIADAACVAVPAPRRRGIRSSSALVTVG